jgi:hypothetical protein
MTLTDTHPTLDLYREVHKGLRRAMFGFCEAAGSLDPDDATARQAFVARFTELELMLTLHHGHEDNGPFGEIIGHLVPELVDELETAHLTAVEGIAALRRAVTAYGTGGQNADELYDQIVSFLSFYLGHMTFEEKTVMAALHTRSTFDELMAVEIGIRTTIAPPDMVVFMHSMLPAMNPQERTNMLGGMKVGAPAEIFDIFWSAAADSLTADQLAVVAGRIGAEPATVAP